MGFFSSGPPRLQVYEAATFIIVVIGLCVLIVSSGFVVLLSRLCGLPNSLKLGAALFSMIIAEAVALWVLACCDRRRAPGYEWEDWKLRKE